MSESALPRQCPQCGGSMPSDSPEGLCPRCLMKAAMASEAQTTDSIRSSAYDTGSGSAARRMPFDPPSVEALAPHFPQLQIIELLGQGGMGAVYKARQRGLDRVIALKILPPDLSERPGFAERFTREARALAKLNHPNIVSVFDFGRTGAQREVDEAAEAAASAPGAAPESGLFFFIMEFIDGTNLRQTIRAKAMTPIEALAIVPQICDALQYAHEEGVVHRDIKPENILLDNRGKVKIADFGLAKLIEAAADDITLTREGGTMGTPHYMAPEQLERAHEVDHRADIYSLGVVFYEMLTGELPLGRFAAPSKKVQIDVRLDEVVLRSLEKEPSLRWQQASEVKTQVDDIRGLSAGAVEGLKRAAGREYRSKATLFGLPLVHIATGIDPKTGKRRVAKGIIAMGDVSIGVLSCGGLAMGGFTFGGVGIGLVSFSGVALALLAAIGGLAIGGVAFGGVAVGGVALGGLAIGYYAAGGGAVGVHVMNASYVSAEARAFFTPWASRWPMWMAVIGIASPLLVGLSSLIMWFALSSKSSTSGWPGEDSGSGDSTEPHSANAPADSTSDDILRQLHAPATWLAGTAVLNWMLAAVLIILMMSLGPPTVGQNREDVPTNVVILAVGITILASAIMLLGALRMKRGEGRGIALFGAVLAMIVTPGNIIGLPVGIWVMEVLHRRKVRESFAKERGDQPSPQASRPTSAGDRAGFIFSVLALVMFSLGLVVPAICMMIDSVTANHVGIAAFGIGMVLAAVLGLIGWQHRLGRVTVLLAVLVGGGLTLGRLLYTSAPLPPKPGPVTGGPAPRQLLAPDGSPVTANNLAFELRIMPDTSHASVGVASRIELTVEPEQWNRLRQALDETGPHAPLPDSNYQWFEDQALDGPVGLSAAPHESRNYVLVCDDKEKVLQWHAPPVEWLSGNVPAAATYPWQVGRVQIVRPGHGQPTMDLRITLDGLGTDALRELTRAHVGDLLGICIAGNVVHIQRIDAVNDTGQIVLPAVGYTEAQVLADLFQQAITAARMGEPVSSAPAISDPDLRVTAPKPQP